MAKRKSKPTFQFDHYCIDGTARPRVDVDYSIESTQTIYGVAQEYRGARVETHPNLSQLDGDLSEIDPMEARDLETEEEEE